MTYRGSDFTLDRVRLRPPPAVPPPLWVGGSIEAALRRSGRLADGWLASLTPPEPFGVARGGRTFGPPEAMLDQLAELAETVIPEHHTR